MEFIAYIGSLLLSAILYVIGISVPIETYKAATISETANLALVMLAALFGILLIAISTINCIKSKNQYNRHKRINA